MVDINTILVDDEQNALDSLEILLSDFSELKIVQKIKDPIDVFPVLINSKIDLIFLDIKMPNLNGIELLQKIRECNPFVCVVIVTAFDNFSMDAVKLNVFSYLLKPVSRVELNATVQEIIKCFNKRIVELEPCKKVFVKSKNNTLLLDMDDVVYIEADGNYTNVYLVNGEVVIASVHMGGFVEKFHKNKFVRVNRSLMVDKNYILSIDKKEKKCCVKINNSQVILDASVVFFKEINSIFLNA